MDNEEPQPSTSKQDQDKRSRKRNSSESEKQDERDASNSTMSSSRSNSPSSTHREHPKSPGRPKKARKERKKKARSAGRVTKRSRRPTKKPTRGTRRSKRITDKKKRREMPGSSIFSGLSSIVSVAQGCPRCGHRCCGRRYYEKKKSRMRRFGNSCRKEKCKDTQISESEPSVQNHAIQAGSRCMMLSPLCLNTNATPSEPQIPEKQTSEITPEMIHEAMRMLIMWREAVNTDDILNYIKRCYPVGQAEGLKAELTEKLRIAAMVGIVTQAGPELWSPSCALMQRELTENHVTLFWKLYGDTMKPVERNKEHPAATGSEPESNAVKDPIRLTYNYI